MYIPKKENSCYSHNLKYENPELADAQKHYKQAELVQEFYQTDGMGVGCVACQHCSLIFLSCEPTKSLVAWSK